MTAHTIDKSERDSAGIRYLTRNVVALFGDLRVALRSLGRAPALWVTVALTLALGIGANTAIFSVVRSVLLRPLVNRDEDRLIYIQQKAPGLQVDNATLIASAALIFAAAAMASLVPAARAARVDAVQALRAD